VNADRFEQDPEVAADIRLRDSSKYDSSRARPSMALLGTWKPEKPAGAWYCRGASKAHPCPQRAIVPVDADTIERLLVFNGYLRARNEDPLDSNEIVRCDACRRGIAFQRPPLLRKRVEEVAECIRQLKASSDPRRERELVKQLEAWHHPDVSGLLQALEEKRKGGSQRVTRASL
jgi:hypothetical protein